MKTITQQNLRALIDTLITEKNRVIGPKQAGTVTLYEPLVSGEELDLSTLPRRSAKESFFPLCETILTFEKSKEGTTIADVDTDRFPATVLVGARPCDAAAPGILDAVFAWDYQDRFFLERREKTTIIGLGCTTCDDACFCTAVGLSPVEPKGSDIFLIPLKDGYRVDVITEKGERLVAAHPSLYNDLPAAEPEPPAAPVIGAFDLKKIKKWLDSHFEDPLWSEIAERCAGCGACAFLCPACHCFDISDEGSAEKGSRRKHWDACGFGKFTNHASGHNPRDVQPARYRNRIMHKFKYYDDKFGQTLCTGCGRCIRHCPVGIDILEVLETINERDQGPGTGDR